MDILDRKFPFVISHFIWKRPPQKEKVKHFVGFVPGLVRLGLYINKLVVEAIEESFYENEVVTTDKGEGYSRHFAFDVGIAETPRGGTVPVLKGVEVTVLPACAHHYTLNRIDNEAFEPEPESRSFLQETLEDKSRDESAKVIEMAQEAFAKEPDKT